MMIINHFRENGFRVKLIAGCLEIFSVGLGVLFLLADFLCGRGNQEVAEHSAQEAGAGGK